MFLTFNIETLMIQSLLFSLKLFQYFKNIICMSLVNSVYEFDKMENFLKIRKKR